MTHSQQFTGSVVSHRRAVYRQFTDSFVTHMQAVL